MNGIPTHDNTNKQIMQRTSSPWLQPTPHTLPREIDEEGNIEYKLKLLDPSPERFEHLVTQLKWRLAEGSGEAMYEVGVSDDGSFVGLSKDDMNASLETLRRMADAVNADISIVREVAITQVPERLITTSGSVSTRFTHDAINPESRISSEGNTVVEVLVRKRLTDERHFLEIRVAIVGAADAGKSTLLGYLAHGIKDNGRGRSRLNLLRHRHEIESGRTSSISHEIIGYDSSGILINYASANITTWEQICEQSSKVITFLDTAGHARYLKTTIAGLTGHAPDYACLLVAANSPSIEMTREHLAIAVLLNVPVFVVITKIDVASTEQIRRVTAFLSKLLAAPGNRRIPTVVENEHTLISAVSNFEALRQIPIFPISSVTGHNLTLLERFFNLLPKPAVETKSLREEDAEFQIEEVFNVPDVGCVVAGVLRAGSITVQEDPSIAQKLWLGPDLGGIFHPLSVTSIHHHRIPTRNIHAGQVATLAISEMPVDLRIRKGMAVLEGPQAPRASLEFEAEVLVLYHPSGLAANFQGMIHCGSVRQSVRVLEIWTISSDTHTISQLSVSPSTSAPITLQPYPSPVPLKATSSAPSSALAIPTPSIIPVPSPHSSNTALNTVQALQTGEKGMVRFKFMHEPEFLRTGAQILLREGRTKCIGKVTRVISM